MITTAGTRPRQEKHCMRKIRLDIDALAVESFSPAAGRGAAGTVRGHQEPLDIPTLDTGIHGCYACPATVLETCLVTCPRTRLICPDTGVAE
jgi:hypothetical protein